MHNYNVNCACFLPLYRKKSDFSFVLCSLIRTFAIEHRNILQWRPVGLLWVNNNSIS